MTKEEERGKEEWDAMGRNMLDMQYILVQKWRKLNLKNNRSVNIRSLKHSYVTNVPGIFLLSADSQGQKFLKLFQFILAYKYSCRALPASPVDSLQIPQLPRRVPVELRNFSRGSGSASDIPKPFENTKDFSVKIKGCKCLCVQAYISREKISFHSASSPGCYKLSWFCVFCASHSEEMDLLVPQMFPRPLSKSISYWLRPDLLLSPSQQNPSGHRQLAHLKIYIMRPGQHRGGHWLAVWEFRPKSHTVHFTVSRHPHDRPMIWPYILCAEFSHPEYLFIKI